MLANYNCVYVCYSVQLRNLNTMAVSLSSTMLAKLLQCELHCYYGAF